LAAAAMRSGPRAGLSGSQAALGRSQQPAGRHPSAAAGHLQVSRTMDAVSPKPQASEQQGPPMLPSVVRVRDYRREPHDTFTLALEAPAAFRFLPGQFNMLYVFGVGEAAIPSVATQPTGRR